MECVVLHDKSVQCGHARYGMHRLSCNIADSSVVYFGCSLCRLCIAASRCLFESGCRADLGMQDPICGGCSGLMRIQVCMHLMICLV